MFLRYLTVVFLLVTAVNGQSTTSVTVDSVSSVSSPTNPAFTQVTTTKNSPKPDANQTTTTMSDKTTVSSTLTPSTHPSSNTTSESTNTTITVPTPTTSVSESEKTTVSSTLTPSTHPSSNTTSTSTNTTITVPTPTTSVSVSDNTTVNSTLTPSTHPSSNTTSTSTNTTITVPTPTTSVSVSDKTTASSTLTPSTHQSSNTTSTSTNTTITVPTPTTSVSVSDNTTVNSTLTPSTHPSSNTTSTSTNTTITVPTPTTSVSGCPSIPCPPQRGCVGGVCLCISGTFLKDDVCEAAQVFPGKLRVLSAFVPEMADRSSKIFQETAKNISDALFKALNDTRGYVRSDVVKLEAESVVATVNNIYQNTNITDQDIQREIEIAAQSDEFLRGATYNITDLCEVEPFPCDETSTTCSSTNGRATCICKEDYVPSPDSNTTCKPSLLAVVVVSCVLGGILLIIVSTLVIYRLWKGPLKISKGKKSYGINPFTSGNGSQPSSTGFKSFIGATTKCDNDAASENDRMPEGGHLQKPQTNEWRESYDINLDEMTSFKGKNPSCNSSVVQGHVNPHYSPGDEKSN